MASINFPSTVGLPIGYEFNDPLSNIKYVWNGVYWDANGPEGLVIPPQREELMPIGAVLPFANGIVPDGWLHCDGSTKLRNSYPDLYQALCVAPGFTPQTFTVDNAGVFTKNGHNFKGGERVRLFTTGSLLVGLSIGIDYFVIPLTVNTFNLSLSKGGAAIDPTGTSQSGTHTYLQSLYGLGDGNTTFNLPDLRDEFIRGAGTIANVGAWQVDTNKAHSHTIGAANNGGVVGAVGNVATGAGSVQQPSTNSSGGAESRPRNVALNYCIKAYKLVTNNDLIDVQDLVLPIEQAAADATWKLLSTVTVTPGQQTIAFDPIPTSAKMIRLAIADLSPAAANAFNVMLQLGASGVYDTTVGHYQGNCGVSHELSYIQWATKPGAVILRNIAGDADNGVGTIELIKLGNTNTWILNSNIVRTNSNDGIISATGKVALIATLNKLKILFDDNGAGNTGFDLGTVALWYL